MSWFPFKFCRTSAAKRLDDLEREMGDLRSQVHLQKSLGDLTYEVAKRSAGELADMIRKSATIRGRCDSCKMLVERPEREWKTAGHYIAPVIICPRCGAQVNGAHKITPKGGAS